MIHLDFALPFDLNFCFLFFDSSKKQQKTGQRNSEEAKGKREKATGRPNFCRARVGSPIRRSHPKGGGGGLPSLRPVSHPHEALSNSVGQPPSTPPLSAVRKSWSRPRPGATCFLSGQGWSFVFKRSKLKNLRLQGPEGRRAWLGRRLPPPGARRLLPPVLGDRPRAAAHNLFAGKQAGLGRRSSP